jgi:hypothetical protein
VVEDDGYGRPRGRVLVAADSGLSPSGRSDAVPEEPKDAKGGGEGEKEYGNSEKTEGRKKGDD